MDTYGQPYKVADLVGFKGDPNEWDWYLVRIARPDPNGWIVIQHHGDGDYVVAQLTELTRWRRP